MTDTKKKHDQIAALLDLEECKQAAYKLFTEIMRRQGLAAARRIFLKYGEPPSANKLRMIRNYALLDRYDMMKPKSNVQRLARELVKENATLPSEERHGPRGSTNQASMDKHIRLLLKEREAALKKRTWSGPITEEQSVQYFGARAEK